MSHSSATAGKLSSSPKENEDKEGETRLFFKKKAIFKTVNCLSIHKATTRMYFVKVISLWDKQAQSILDKKEKYTV